MKGTVLDFIAVIVVLFVFSLSTIIGMTLFNEIRPELNASLTTSIKTSVFDSTQQALTSLDYLIVFALFGLIVAVILATVFLQLHPAFMVISLIVLAFVIFLAAQFTNIFFTFTNDSSLSAASAQYPYTLIVWNNLPTIILFAGIAVIIIMFARFGGGSGTA